MAQLDNAADSDSEERGFESLRAGQKNNNGTLAVPLLFFSFNQTKGFEGRASILLLLFFCVSITPRGDSDETSSSY